MELFETIRTRQSIGKVKPDPVAREVIERLLDAAVQAPNHHKLRPWRFVVLTGAARERLGEVMAESLRRRDPNATDDALARERAKPLRAPVLIAVGVDKPGIPKAIEIENVCAAAAAVQNLLLAAHALDPAVKTFLGFEPDQHVIAFVYVGYPESAPTPPSRPSYADRAGWLE